MTDIDNVDVNGEPLEMDETYILATNNWVAANDGGYVRRRRNPNHRLSAHLLKGT